MAAVQVNGRCAFFVACGNRATRYAQHTHLGRRIKVCDRCAKTNQYLKPEAR